MGVAGAWSFLQQKDIQITKSNDIRHYSGIHQYKIIHIDMVGAFYESIRRNFLNTHEDDERKKFAAANRLLTEISTLIDKRRCKLYIDGKPTLERDFGHGKRLESLLLVQEQLEKEITEYNKSRTKSRHRTIMSLIRKLFRVSPDIEDILYRVAVRSGWNVVVAKGEAEVEIGRVGGVVMSQDSDMLFYPKIHTVICPFDGAFRFYKKSVILRELDLTTEFFTAMGIVAKNDYNQNLYVGENTENDRDFHRNNMDDIYKELIDIKKESNNLGNLSGSSLIRVILKTYVSFMNVKAGKDINVDAYDNSYNIFALQEEQLLIEAYDARAYDINRSVYYLDQIYSVSRYGRS